MHLIVLWCLRCYHCWIFLEEKNPFKVEKIDPEHIPIEDLIEHRKKQYKQKKTSKENKKLVKIDININGPIGIAHFGDPHVDDDGTDLSQIIHYMTLINNTKGMFAGNLEFFKSQPDNKSPFSSNPELAKSPHGLSEIYPFSNK